MFGKKNKAERDMERRMEDSKKIQLRYSPYTSDTFPRTQLSITALDNLARTFADNDNDSDKVPYVCANGQTVMFSPGRASLGCGVEWFNHLFGQLAIYTDGRVDSSKRNAFPIADMLAVRDNGQLKPWAPKEKASKAVSNLFLLAREMSTTELHKMPNGSLYITPEPLVAPVDYHSQPKAKDLYAPTDPHEDHTR